MSFWQLIGFEDALDRWISVEDPSIDLRFAVTEWVLSRTDDAYAGVRRRPEVGPNYWFGIVPGTQEGRRVVVCGYWIDEHMRALRCDTIASLDLPVA